MLLLHVCTLILFFTFHFTCSECKRVLVLQAVTEDYFAKIEHWDTSQYPYSFTALSQLSASSYAQRHGYDYNLFTFPKEDLQQYHVSWVPLFAFRTFLASANASAYDYVMVLDNDVIFMEPTVPILDKLKQWTDPSFPWQEVDVFLAQNSDRPHNHLIPYGQEANTRVLNAGFQVWKVTERTHGVIDTWISCAEETCKKYMTRWPFSSGTFTFLQDYLKAQPIHQLKIQPISCDEANGFPSSFNPSGVNDDCAGRFIAHISLRERSAYFRQLNSFVMKDVTQLKLQKIQKEHSRYYLPPLSPLPAMASQSTSKKQLPASTEEIIRSIVQRFHLPYEIQFELSSPITVFPLVGKFPMNVMESQEVELVGLQQLCDDLNYSKEVCQEIVYFLQEKFRLKKEYIRDYLELIGREYPDLFSQIVTSSASVASDSTNTVVH